jgi:hypothetical protein
MAARIKAKFISKKAMNKSEILPKHGAKIDEFLKQVHAPVEPPEYVTAAQSDIDLLEAKGKKIPDALRKAAQHDPLQNATAEHTTGFLYGCILELKEQIDALKSAVPPKLPAV